ncbi:putative gustatory receptor 28b [Neodiprion lecontei]|uniref:Gustatory receptor 28b n=1 Tax=Neodiprion lecontei TaxID=441921 RepID=A0ABM3FNB6_NEOLC|nr:putative gustatory receptor 28b [Neodiprion lecontei]
MVSDSSDERSDAGGFLSFALFNCIQVMVLVLLCSTTTTQARRAGKLIHKFTFSELDTGLEDVIQLFSLQLYHEKIEFSGLGLFRLDPSLVQLIAASVTGYLVILAQFDAGAANATIRNGANSSLA